MTQRNRNTPDAPEGTKPEGNGDNGAVQSPADKLAALRAAQAEAAAKAQAIATEAEALEEGIRKEAQAEAMKGIAGILGTMKVAAEAGEAQAVVDAFRGDLTTSVKALVEALGIKVARGKGNGPRPVAGGAIRDGSDADLVNKYLAANPGFHTVAEIAKGIGYDGVTGPDKRDGQVRNACEKCANPDLPGGAVAVKGDVQGTLAFAHREPPRPEVLAGVTASEPVTTTPTEDAPSTEGDPKE